MESKFTHHGELNDQSIQLVIAVDVESHYNRFHREQANRSKGSQKGGVSYEHSQIDSGLQSVVRDGSPANASEIAAITCCCPAI